MFTKKELTEIHNLPMMELLSKAHQIHIQYHKLGEVQIAKLVNFKTGGCTEDCKYCSQSMRYKTTVSPLPFLQHRAMIDLAKEAMKHGVTRVCIGAAWREVREGKAFDTILKTVKDITEMGIEVCCTLGMLTVKQVRKLKEAGLFAYNHNLDSSKKFYQTIISTRSYEHRLETISKVGEANMQICSGGIIGMGETLEDRIELIYNLMQIRPFVESVPINCLIPIPGTPLENRLKVTIWEMIRMIATARIAMPKSIIRFSAGRLEYRMSEQTLCFLAGVNSIFYGDKLLTANNCSENQDETMIELLGIKKRAPFQKHE